MKAAPKERSGEEGMAVAKELIDAAFESTPGFYIMPQLENYEVAAELVRYIKQRAEKRNLRAGTGGDAASVDLKT